MADLSNLPTDVTGWDRLRRPVWVFDAATRRGLYANATALALWGADSLDELLGRDFSRLSPAVLTRLDRLAQGTTGGEAITERWTFYPKGSPVTVQAVISALALIDGREALLFEAAPVDLEEEERRAVEALRHTSSLVTLFGADGRPLFVNPAAFAAYGGDKTGFAERFDDALVGAQVLAEVLDGQVLARFCQVRTVAGARAHHLDARQVLDPVTGEAGILLSERDVTAQVEAEKALLAARDQADVAAAKQRFLANMSHELRTPLNSVLGFTAVLAQDGLNEVQQEHLSRITRAGDGLLNIINDMISLSELDLGELTFDARPFDPAAMLDETLRVARADAADKGLTLRLDLAADLPAGLVGDAAQLAAVTRNFLSNAVRFSSVGEIVLAGAWVDGVLEISVRDQGPGIDAATQARLFERFSLADDGMRKRAGGAGLGLAVSHELIYLMEGQIGVDSAPGEGSRFWIRVTLPIAEGAAVVEGAVREQGPLSILYADDHEANRRLVQAMLATQGHGCHLVCDGAEAVAAARDGAYDLILMDIQMPVLDGVAATREIRTLPGRPGQVPIVALTANTLSEQLESYAAAGMNDCIAKPVGMVDLLTKTMMWAEARREALTEDVRVSA